MQDSIFIDVTIIILFWGLVMKKKKWNRVLAVFFVMLTALSLLSGCGEKRAEEDAETITVYLWSTKLYEKYAP